MVWPQCTRRGSHPTVVDLGFTTRRRRSNIDIARSTQAWDRPRVFQGAR